MGSPKRDSKHTDEANCSWFHPIWPPPKRPDRDSKIYVVSRTSTKPILCIHRVFDVRNNVFKTQRIVRESCRDIDGWKLRAMKPTVLGDEANYRAAFAEDEANSSWLHQSHHCEFSCRWLRTLWHQCYDSDTQFLRWCSKQQSITKALCSLLNPDTHYQQLITRRGGSSWWKLSVSFPKCGRCPAVQEMESYPHIVIIHIACPLYLIFTLENSIPRVKPKKNSNWA